MNKNLYEFHELIAGVLEVGEVAETVNLGELNYKLWFSPKTFKLEYKDYPDQPVEIICAGNDEYDNTLSESGEPTLFRIIHN